ncbi:MAG: radical SAM protein [Chloroflexota bacterium]
MREPSYLKLHKSGDLAHRAETLLKRLASCDLCPRACGIDRITGATGFCRTAREAVVASACVHRGEEPPISGSHGSGTIFFSGCNMRCVFCQNYQISQGSPLPGGRHSVDGLADIMCELQDAGCHNVNLVSPSHVVAQIVEAIALAVPKGLRLPLVYNTNGYDSVEVLRMLDGVVDVYLPDLKYSSNAVAARFSAVSDYVEVSRAAILEMYRQVGDQLLMTDGAAQRGLIIRHLVLPGGLAGTRECLTWLARNVSTGVSLSLMSQYYPAHRAREFPLLSRRTSQSEYAEAVRIARDLGFEHVWVQDETAQAHYRPDFEAHGHPFERPSF